MALSPEEVRELYVATLELPTPGAVIALFRTGLGLVRFAADPAVALPPAEALLAGIDQRPRAPGGPASWHLIPAAGAGLVVRRGRVIQDRLEHRRLERRWRDRVRAVAAEAEATGDQQLRRKVHLEEQLQRLAEHELAAAPRLGTRDLAASLAVLGLLLAGTKEAEASALIVEWTPPPLRSRQDRAGLRAWRAIGSPRPELDPSLPYEDWYAAAEHQQRWERARVRWRAWMAGEITLHRRHWEALDLGELAERALHALDRDHPCRPAEGWAWAGPRWRDERRVSRSR